MKLYVMLVCICILRLVNVTNVWNLCYGFMLWNLFTYALKYDNINMVCCNPKFLDFLTNGGL